MDGEAGEESGGDVGTDTVEGLESFLRAKAVSGGCGEGGRRGHYLDITCSRNVAAEELDL